MTCDGVILCGDINSEFSLSFTEGNIGVIREYIKFIKQNKHFNFCIFLLSRVKSYHFICQHLYEFLEVIMNAVKYLTDKCWCFCT